MSRTKKNEKMPVQLGRPSGYDPAYCQMLITHMRGGNSFESFGAVVHCHVATLYNWQQAHQDFFEARKVGMTYLRQFYENLGKTIATGQLRRVVSERPMLDNSGEPMVGPDGQVLMDRQYAPALPNAAVFIFMTKNMLGWRNEVNLTIEEPPPAPRPAGVTPVETLETDTIKARMKQLMMKAAADDPELLESLKRLQK